jgi:Zn-dependent protease with chaperone function
MNTRNLIIGDYKKWLLYSFGNQEFNSFVALFKALESGRPSNKVSISPSDGNSYLISVDSLYDDLQLNSEERSAFKDYLVEIYFHTHDVDALVLERKQSEEKKQNHNVFGPKREAHYKPGEDLLKVKQHPKEQTYFSIRLIISITAYFLLVGIIVYGSLVDLSLLFGLLIIVPIIFVLFLFNGILKGIFIGLIRGNSIRVTKEQYPEIYKVVEEMTEKLSIDVPEIFISVGHFNAFVTRFSRAHILMLYSEVVETALKGDWDVLRYVVGHELCHIKQKHLVKEKYLIPSRIVPFLGLAYSRACEYTCDRIGYQFSPKGSIEGILIMTTGKEIHSKFNAELHIQNSVEQEGFWTWLSEKFLTHPHLYKRLLEIKKYSKYN